MEKQKTRNVLQVLINEFPRQLSIKHFSVPQGEEQNFLNFLYELNHRDLLTGLFRVSNMCDSYGTPKDVQGLSITKEGRKFMEDNEGTGQAKTTIIVTASDDASVPINVAERDINITNNADADKLLQAILENIEKANMPPEEKRGVAEAIKSLFAKSAPGVISGLLIEAAKKFI